MEGHEWWATVLAGDATAALPALAATPVPSGKWSFVFTDAKGHADRPVRVYTYRPRQCDVDVPYRLRDARQEPEGVQRPRQLGAARPTATASS